MDVDVYTYEACSAVPYQSDFRNDGAKGWIFVGATAGTTTCGSDVILGGYNVLDMTDQAQRLVELPMHTSLTVDFTWVMVRSLFWPVALWVLALARSVARARIPEAFALCTIGCAAVRTAALCRFVGGVAECQQACLR